VSIVVDEHRQYLADDHRVGAFQRAIAEVVRPGDIVLDLGSGTAILGMLACRAGAQRVYSVEETGMIGLAREIAEANGLAGTIEFVKGYSLRLELPEKVDVVVADQIGRFGFDAGIIEYFTDARTRFLKPGGRMIPSVIDLWIAPVECAELWRQVAFWSEPHAGLAFTPARALACNTGYGTTLRKDNLLATPLVGQSIDPSKCGVGVVSLQASFRAARQGSLHGIGGWFSAQLSPTVRMSNSPLEDDRINRSNVFFPLERQVDLREGDTVQVSLKILPEQVMVSWNVDVFSAAAGGQRTLINHCKQSTFKGMLLSQEDLKRTQPQFMPNLNPWGKARASVVNLCDGTRTVAQIEGEVFSRHSGLFRSHDDVSEFVAEVVTRYSA
jgi:hypothetical protein